MQSTSRLKKPTTIGLVGGIASGKSFVARQLAELGAAVIDADKIAHDVLKQPLVIRRLAQIFGEQIVRDDAIDRQALAALVFGEDAASALRLEELEAVVHPLIHAEAVRLLRQYAEQETPPTAVVVDAPLLLEAKWAPLCDAILFVDAPWELRVERAARRGWTEAQLQRREAKQLSLNEKRAAATHVVSSGTESEVVLELRNLWRQLVELSKGGDA